jgi:hypothetical protein
MSSWFMVFNAEWQSSRVAERFGVACGRGSGVDVFLVHGF